MEWKIGNKCYIMTKEQYPLKCVINRPHIFVGMWVLYNCHNNYYWGARHERDFFKTKKELLQHHYGA